MLASTTRLLIEAERAVIGTPHSEIGAYLLWLRGLPDNVNFGCAASGRNRPGVCFTFYNSSSCSA